MKPYVKQYESAILVNPITKEKPYLHPVNKILAMMTQSKRRYWAIVNTLRMPTGHYISCFVF